MPGESANIKKILLVDDQEPVRQVLAATFSASDRYRILYASDGIEALRKAKAEKPDIILLDLLMPGRNGFDVCRTVKADPDTCGATVIVLSGTASDKDIEDARNAGADGYVAKPFRPIALRKRIEEEFGI